MMIIKHAKNRGFTLVELMIVVAIIGVLAALAIYGVRRYVFTAKTAEAKSSVGRIAKDASGSYNAERMEGTTMGLGTSKGGTNRFCEGSNSPAETTSVPSTRASVAAMKWQSSPSDWNNHGGFACLGFSMQDPQYYMYDYATSCTGDCSEEGDEFTAAAFGDLDGDTTLSTYYYRGAIQADTTVTTALVVTLAPSYESTDDLE